MGATNDLVQCDLYLWRGPGLPPQDKDQIQLILSLGNPPQSHSEISERDHRQPILSFANMHARKLLSRTISLCRNLLLMPTPRSP